MGAEFFKDTYRGKTLQDAYNSAVADAIFEHGNDPYSGTIATTTGFIVADKTKEYKASGKSLSDYIDTWVDNGEKRRCYAICIEEPKVNSSKIKSKVEHFVEKGTKKWILKYTVSDYDTVIGNYNTKGDAIKAARLYTEKNLRTTTINMTKVLEKGNTRVARVEYKRSVNEKDGKWVLFGWAAC
mgnify:CR=1 FL=1